MLIGKDAARIRHALAGTGAALVDCDSLEQAVSRSAEYAGEGDIVLLSPACASMDMFRDYAHRSEVFVSEVYRLRDACGEGQP